MSTSNSVTATAVAVPATTETVLVVTPVRPVNNPGGSGEHIHGFINVTYGGTAGTMTITLRRGPLVTSPSVTTDTVTTVASEVDSVPFDFIDSTVNNSAGQAYTITATITGAAATVNRCTASVEDSNAAQ